MKYCMKCSTKSSQKTCWFCTKGRHSECMGEIPVEMKTEGPHDCTFDTEMIKCGCTHE